MKFYSEREGDQTTIFIKGPTNIKVEGASIKMTKKPKSYQVLYGNVELIEGESAYFLVFDAVDNQQLEVTY